MHGRHYPTRRALDAFDHQADFLHRILGTPGQVAHFVRHYRETTPAFPGARGFNRGIELIEIIFQDGANGASYQRIDGGDTVWSADSAVAAWGHYGLPVATQRVAPNKQVSWAGSGRLDPRKLQQALGQAFDSPSSFQDSLQKAPSKTLAEASLLSDGEAGPDGQASSLMEKMLQEAGVDSAADKPTELMVRVQNASRISQQAGLKEQRRLELMRDCAKLPSWGQPLPLEFKDRITTGVSKEGFPVAKAASASLDSLPTCVPSAASAMGRGCSGTTSSSRRSSSRA